MSGGKFDNQGVTGPNGSESSGSLYSDTTYTLRVVLHDGSERTRSVTVDVISIPPPAPSPLEPGTLEPSKTLSTIPQYMRW